MTIYKEDILKSGFEQTVIPLKDDYEGSNIATLIRRRVAITSNKAILYIHGFNDYFFQEELASVFNKNGFNFYAIDLRKYGRSYLPHQKFNDIRNLKDYYEEITTSLNIIHDEGNTEAILMGHSTGGLISTLFAKDFSGSNLFDGVILNSPFYDFNLPTVLKILIPAISTVGSLFPKIRIHGGFTEEYGKSIHKDYYGEWNYILKWKPNIAPFINLGWLRAIHKGQQELRKPFNIKQPVLVMHSDKSVANEKDKNQMLSTDAILNIEQIDKIARNIEGNVNIETIRGGLHDLILSQKPVRKKVYSVIFDWINKHKL